MAAKVTRLTHKIATQLYLVTVIPFAVLAPGGQSGNFWIHPRARARVYIYICSPFHAAASRTGLPKQGYSYPVWISHTEKTGTYFLIQVL
jgi:hypothetical protein